MNWLAHVFLSKNDIEHQLGNLLTDPLKARAWDDASERIIQGMDTHKRIDMYTDSHPIVLRSKAHLVKRGHLKGVVLDILYDYYLSKHWKNFSGVKRVDFLETFHTEALKTIIDYPNKPRVIIERVVKTGQLSSYHSMNGVEAALGRIDKRLSVRAKSKDTAIRYLPIIIKENAYLEEAFLDFFPELMIEISKNLPKDSIKHWKI